MQPWHIPVTIWNQSIVLCPLLTVASWPAYRFFRRQVRWSGVSISLRIFPFVVIHTVKRFDVVSEAEVDVFLEFSCFFYKPLGVCNLISGFSTFSESSLNIQKFSIHILLEPVLENFEHYFNSTCNECNCVVVWTFFGIALLCGWNENWSFLVLWPLLSFPNLLDIDFDTFRASSFRIWNSSAGILSPPLILFIVMLPRAHMTSTLQDVWQVIEMILTTGSESMLAPSRRSGLP